MPTTSTSDANVSVSEIQTKLSQTSTMTSVTTFVDTASQASADPEVLAALASTTVTDNTVGVTTAPTTSTKVTVEGELDVTGLDPAAMDADQTEEAKSLFERAITQQLESDGLLTDGASVAVTGFKSDGTVLYEVHFYNETSDNASASITVIESALSSNETLDDIMSSKY